MDEQFLQLKMVSKTSTTTSACSPSSAMAYGVRRRYSTDLHGFCDGDRKRSTRSEMGPSEAYWGRNLSVRVVLIEHEVVVGGVLLIYNTYLFIVERTHSITVLANVCLLNIYFSVIIKLQ